MRLGRGIGVVAIVGALVLGAAAVAGALDAPEGRVGPDLGLLGNGRALHPAGAMAPLGNFPTGGALTPDGRFYWTVSTGRGINDIRIVDVDTAKVVQVLPLPGGSGGIAMDPSSRTAYVSGTHESSHRDEQAHPTPPGAGGDVIHVFTYDGSGHATFDRVIPVPPPSDAPTPQDFPPTNVGQKLAWPDRLAVSPNGKRLLVPLNLADAAAIVDVPSGSTRYVKTGNYPYGAAILRDGKTGLVSNETPGTVSVIDLDSGTKKADLQVSSHLSHPEGITVDPVADRAYVAIANTDQIAVIDTKKMVVDRQLSLDRPELGGGVSPVDVATTADGAYLLAAEEGADDVAVFRTGSFDLVGRIPTAAVPTDVDVTQRSCAAPRTKGRRHPARPSKAPNESCNKLVWIAAKGMGIGPNPNGPNPLSPNDSDDNINTFQYMPSITFGRAGVLDFPSEGRIRKLSAEADAQLHPSNAESPPPGTPLRPDGPIKHVFYIVRENRTYDQVLGDIAAGDGDPNLTLFGRTITPNMHALVERFGLVDHVYANSEASIDGHFWTSAAGVSDYVQKNWHANYGGRGRPYDFGVYSVTWPGNGFLFDQAERDNISYFNYGEAIAGVVPLTDKDRNAAETAEVATKLAHSDIQPGVGGCYPNDASINTDAITKQEVWDSSPPAGAPQPNESRFDCFKTHFLAQDVTGTVPAFNYIVLPNDHTVGLSPGQRTPKAMIADNDYGLGQFVDLISHSNAWKSSAIFVIEDDSQDGADHVDAHRIPAAVISPYAKGGVTHTRYDFLSVIRSIELIVGMHPLGLADRLATPMYDAFASTPVNGSPFVAQAITPDIRNERNAATAANAAAMRGLNLRSLDRVPQRTLDRILWQSVHGPRSKPPPPGPGAEGETEPEHEH
jgi:DNA-binding beta-propeller fold protein YncE